MQSAHMSSVVSTSGADGKIPAEWTKASTRPCQCQAALATEIQLSLDLRSMELGLSSWGWIQLLHHGVSSGQNLGFDQFDFSIFLGYLRIGKDFHSYSGTWQVQCSLVVIMSTRQGRHHLFTRWRRKPASLYMWHFIALKGRAKNEAGVLNTLWLCVGHHFRMVCHAPKLQKHTKPSNFNQYLRDKKGG